MPDPLDDHEVGGLYVTATLAYVRRACGEVGVTDLLARAGLDPSAVPGDNDWLSLRRMLAIAVAAQEVTGDPEVGRRVGEELYELNLANGIDQMMRAAGGPVEAIALMASHGSRLAGGWTLEVTAHGDDYAEITSSTDLETDVPYFCGTGMGYYRRIPEVFGHRATAIHPECMTKGAPHCRYIMRWGAPFEVKAGPSFDPIHYFERMQSVATELAAAPTPDALIELAAANGPAVTTSRSIIVRVELAPGRVLLGHRGIDDAEQIDDLIERATNGAAPVGEEPVIAVAPIGTNRADYGWIASLHPPRSTIDWTVERPLVAFADHIASALEGAVAHEEARRDRDTANALVALARDLAASTEVAEVVALVTEAVGQATPAEGIDVWLIDPDDHLLRSALTGESVVALPTADPATIAVPLTARNTELGSLTVTWPNGATPSGSELERLRAMADQAALAFDVVGLVADLKRQARHDPLSGLANRALLAERAELALSHARRHGTQIGLLFIDLDRFKEVNDRYGHAGGDDIICQVSDRLRSVVRANDTVARFGGDEFVVLLTDLPGEQYADSAEAANSAGHRVLDVMREPFFVGGEAVEVSATVGVHATAPGDLTWSELVDRADAAMYAGKQQGRNAVVNG